METRQNYLESLGAINQDVLRMGTLVEESIRKAIHALKERNVDLAQTVFDEDEKINQMELSIQDKCIVLIATEQPVASDLRGLVTTIKIVTQLERMGDHALHVAKGVIDLPRMADCAIRMIYEVLTAFMNNDHEKAIAVAAMDDEIDELHLLRQWKLEAPTYTKLVNYIAIY